MPSSDNALVLYQRILTAECIREVQFLLDVGSGRATAKADFTDKLLAMFSSKLGEVVTELPGGAWLSSALVYPIEWKNALRKKAKQDQATLLGHQTEPHRLRIVLDTVAMEAARRYQFFITEYLSDKPLEGVIPFAKTGVERMLEYVLRHQLNLEEEHLLDGLIKGRSGKYVSGSQNTRLNLKVQKQRKHYTAEGAYARSGLMATDGRLSATRATNLLDKTIDPKYGYCHVPEAVRVAEQGVFQVKTTLSKTLQQRLEAYQPKWETITKSDIDEYLKTINPKTANSSLLSFMSGKRGCEIERLFYVGETKDDWDLTAFNFQSADLSDCVFNHCVFANSFEGARFDRSYLRQADISRVSSAKKASFKDAYIEFIEAMGVDFTQSDFTQVHAEYGCFNKSTLTACQTLGAEWAYANLDDVVIDSEMDQLTEDLLQDVASLKAQQETKLKEHTAQFSRLTEQADAQQQAIQALQTDLTEFRGVLQTQADAHAEEKAEVLASLADLSDELVQEQQARLAFERYCQAELAVLKTQHDQAGQTTAAEIARLQDTIETLKAQDDQFQKMIESIQKTLKDTQAQVKTNTLDIESLQRMISASEEQLQTQLDQQAEALSHLTQRIDQLEVQHAKTDVRLSALESRLKQAAVGVDVQTTAVKVQQLIQSRYQADNQIRGVFGKPLSMFEESGGYVNLQIIVTGKVEKSKEASDGRSDKANETTASNSPRDERINSFEDLFGEKRALSLPQLFEPAEKIFSSAEKENLVLEHENPQQSPRLLFVQGRAGVGKTTCVRYLAHQWSQGKLWPEHEWVFVLPFRALRSPHFSAAQRAGKIYSLWQWVYHHYGFSAEDISETEFRVFWQQVIEMDLSKAIFVLDGLDEAPSEHPCEAAFNQLLHGEKYTDCRIMITTRPTNSAALPQQHRDLEVMGLTNENIKHYTQHYFDGSEQANDLVKHLKGQPNLWGMAHIPVTLNMLCGLYEQRADEFNSLNTMSQLYETMEVQLLILAAEREADALKAQGKPSINDVVSFKEKIAYVREQYALHRRVLAKLALEGLQKQQILLPENALDELIAELIASGELARTESAAFKQTILNLGLLKYSVDKAEGDDASACYLEFLHYTFQEYYAAVASAHMLKTQEADQPNAFLDELLISPRYQIMFWLMVGLLRDDEQAVNALFEQLIHPSPNGDLIGEYRLGLLVRGLEEVLTEKNKKTYRKALEACLERLSAWHSYYDDYISRRNGRRYDTYRANWDGGRFKDESVYLVEMLRLSPHVFDELSLINEEKPVIGSFCSIELEQWARSHAFFKEVNLFTSMMLIDIGKLLKAESAGLRREGLAAVRAFGAGALTNEILSGLTSCLIPKSKFGELSDDEFNERVVQQSAANVLGHLGPSAATDEVLSGMAKGLSDGDPTIRQEMLSALSCLDASAATPAFLSSVAEGLEVADSDVRKTMFRVVRSLGPSAATDEILSGMAKGLSDGDPAIRKEVLYTLERLGVSAATPAFLSSVAEGLEVADSDVRETMFCVVRCLGPLAATPAILLSVSEGLRAAQSEIRYAALNAVSSLGPSAATEAILLGVSEGLRAAQSEIRYAALNAVSSLGSAAATGAVLSSVKESLEELDVNVCRAAFCLAEKFFSAIKEEFLAGLAEGLKNADEDIRGASFERVTYLGSRAATEEILLRIAEGLRDVVRDTDNGMRIIVFRAAMALGPSAATEAILLAVAEGLQVADYGVRRGALYVVNTLGPAAATKTFLSKIAGGLKAVDDKIRGTVFAALKSLGAAAATETIVSVLAECLTNNQAAASHRDTFYALVDLGPPAATEAFLSAVAKDLEDGKGEWGAFDALEALGKPAATKVILTSVAKGLLGSYGGNDALFRILGRMGVAVFKPIFEGLKDPNLFLLLVCLSQRFGVSVSVQWQKYHYEAWLFTSQEFVSHRLSEAEAQYCRHFIPAAADLVMSHPIEEVRSKLLALTQQKLPEVSSDPLMPECHNIFIRFDAYAVSLTPAEDKRRVDDVKSLLEVINIACNQATVKQWIKSTSKHVYRNPRGKNRFYHLRQALKKCSDARLVKDLEAYRAYLQCSAEGESSQVQKLRAQFCECLGITSPTSSPANAGTFAHRVADAASAAADAEDVEVIEPARAGAAAGPG